MTNYEPTQEDIDYLNSIEGKVGVSKPRVEKVTEEGSTVPYWHPDAEEGDNNAASPEQAWA